MKQRIVLLMMVGGAATALGATIEWDAGGDTVSTYQEANWVVTDNTDQPTWVIGADPPGGSVDGATQVFAHAIVGGAATAGGVGAGADYNIASGYSLTVKDNAVFRMGISDGKGINGVEDSVDETLYIRDDGLVVSQFLCNIVARMSGNANLELNGGNDPINQSFIDLASDWTGSIHLFNEMVEDWSDPDSSNPGQPAHIEDITVAGQPAVIGVNVAIISDGGAGSILFIPEPTTGLLLGIGVLAAVRRR